MKKVLFLLLAGVLYLSHSLGQTINMPVDDVATLLCKKWEIDYAKMGRMSLGRNPAAPETIYEFKRDNSFTLTTVSTGRTSFGTWLYDPVGKLIILKGAEGTSNSSIISISDENFILVPNVLTPTPGSQIVGVKFVYKVKPE